MTVNDYPDSIGVMWPAFFTGTYPMKEVDKMHITCMYLGEIPDVNFTREELIDTISGLGQMYFYGEITGVERFGPRQDIPVLRVDHQQLYTVQAEVEKHLAAVGINSASSFPEYKPHVTVNEEIFARPPEVVRVHPLMVWWGNERVRLH